MCGIIGLYNNPEAGTFAYMGLYAQQHRGQEGAGIVTCDGDKMYSHTGQGLVSDVFSDSKIFDNLKGHYAIGHTRYSTTGENNATNVGPLLFNLGDSFISIAHNGNLVNLTSIRKKLQKNGAIFQTTTDTEIIIHLLARRTEPTLTKRIAGTLKEIEGAFSIIIISKEGLHIARDTKGIRPLCFGKLNDTIIVASETCALDLLGAQYIRDINPGELLTVNNFGESSIQFETPDKNKSHCIFEYIYFSRPDSQVFGENVDKMRRKFGKTLAEESTIDSADIVISVPDSSNTCAMGYAATSNTKYEIGLIRNHYVGRTFIFPNQRLRSLNVRLKFNTVKGVLDNREVVLVDDSIVRGTTLRKLSQLLKDAGVKKVHVRISSPPVRYPCHYGMDFPTKDELAANKHTVNELAEIIKVDTLNYLTIEGLLKSVSLNKDDYCTACFSGEYPIEIKDKVGKEIF
ncbi:MAG: amidophosphoribosyltransferase [Candidatus Marinimicrobia bacterium]|nr:amidophosphoribosyltransferase [Candidatus Neomarinimicrobiota bacterium]